MKSIPIEILHQSEETEEFIFYYRDRKWLYFAQEQETNCYVREGWGEVLRLDEFWELRKQFPCFRPILQSSFRDSFLRAISA